MEGEGKGKVDIPRVIEALQESQNDPGAAIRKLSAEAEQLEGEAEALRQVAGAIRLLTGEQSNAATTETGTQTAQETPRGTEAVRRVMREGGVWTKRTMFEELHRRGWDPKDAQHPHAAVEAAIDRLYRVKKEIERVGRGEYTYKSLPASPGPETLSEALRAS